jgi:hypothetical protein
VLLLHVSDLHVTEPGETLDSLWLRAERGLSLHERGPFDFVLVTGDLSQRAAPEEYETLLRFAESRLLPLVPAGERARVVFVPGNHDVDWAARIGEPLDLSSASPAELEAVQKQLELYKGAPELSQLRLNLGRAGHVGLVRLDPARYQQRLANVQRFLDAFYGDALAARGRKFELLDPHPAEHFSLHVFPEEKVAFAGFSSVHRNDRWWTGASISPEAVVAASELLQKRAPDLLRVAAWHHGFTADRGRPDSLTLQDVGMLWAAGFRVGFHGHTHRAAARIEEMLQGRFAIVATGSLGAGSPDRPDAVGNQVSVVRLTAGSAAVEVLEKQGEAGEYRRTRRPTIDLTPRAPRREQLSQTRAALHRRRFTVRRDGIARAQVELHRFEAEPDAPLAVLTPPFCSVLAEPAAEADAGRVPVRQDRRDDGRIAFLLAQPEPRALKRVLWTYHVSNALSLNRGELSLLEERQRWYPNLPAEHDLVCHTARYESDRLELEVEYEESAGVLIERALALVEERVESGGEVFWQRSEPEERRCTVLLDGRTAALHVVGPLVGRRYGVAFRLANAGAAYPERTKLDVAEVLRHCFGAQPGRSAKISERLSWAMEAVLQGVLAEKAGLALQGDSFGNRTTSMGMLWDPEGRLLRPAFGRFWPQSWSARFACGEGVAGHAFRFCVPAGWHAEAASARHAGSIVFQAHPQHHLYSRSYRWVLSLPIKASEAVCVGAFTIASEDEGTSAERLLARVARVTSQGIDDPFSRGLRSALERSINLAFWAEVARSEELTGPVRDEARAVMTRFTELA